MWSLVKGAATPHAAWSHIEDAMMDADNLATAVQKFDGSHAMLQAWLRKNRLTLRFAGFPVDDALPGKLAGGLMSLTGAGLFVFVRSMGWA